MSSTSQANACKGKVFNWTLLTAALAILIFPAVSPASPPVMDESEALSSRTRTYDVLHYAITVDLDVEKRMVSGSTAITFIPVVPLLDSIVLDAAEMEIDSVIFPNGDRLRFVNASPHLTVYLPRALAEVETTTVMVQYRCSPSTGLFFVQPDSTDPTRRNQVWTQGEETDNHYWFPCYDFPDDKATSEVTATVPERFTLVSNGRLVVVRHDSVARTKTYHWSQSLPHSSYLIMLAAGEYALIEEQYGTLPLQYYVYDERKADAMNTFAKTASIMKFMEDQFEVPYPWEKFAQIFLNGFPIGGMENTSAVTLNEVYILDRRAMLDFSGDDVVAHELAHQWWGDLVTCRDWTHLWLNEGFANYFEALFKQYDKGDDEFRLDMNVQARAVFTLEEKQGRKPLVSRDSYPTNVYSKGCWVLAMLRTTLGDDAFWRTIRLYLKRHAFGNVETRDLQQAAEEISGQQLGWFFGQWVYGTGFPMLNVENEWDEDANVLHLRVNQIQAMDSLTGVFRFPLDIECTTAESVVVSRVWIEGKENAFEVMLPSEPTMVLVDKDNSLLCKIEMSKSMDEYLFQLAHAQSVVHRMTAAKQLRTHIEDGRVFSALRYGAERDPFWAVRREATISLGVALHDSLPSVLMRIARERDARVRGAAIVALEQIRTRAVADFLDSVARTDSSYMVVSAAITAMTEVDSARAFDIAQRHVGEKSYRDIVQRAALHAMISLQDPRGLRYALRYARPGNSDDIRSLSVRLLGETGAGSNEAKEAVTELLGDHDASVRKSTVRVLAEWGTVWARELLEARKPEEADDEVLNAIDDALLQIGDGENN